MQRKELGIAVVGSGRIGTLRARLAAKHPSVGFLAISDQDPARARALAEQTGADFHSGSNDEVISRPEVTAVFVSTPEGEHAAPVKKALELGKPVLVEKPLALTLADADDILDTWRKTGGDLRIGYSRRFKECFLRAKEQMIHERFGRVVGGTARVYNSRAQAFSILKRSAHATPVLDVLTYYVDLMCWFLEGNPPVEVVARGQMGVFKEAGYDAHDVTWGIVTLRDGAVINLGVSYALPTRYPTLGQSDRVELLGAEGTMIIDDDHMDHLLVFGARHSARVRARSQRRDGISRQQHRGRLGMRRFLGAARQRNALVARPPDHRRADHAHDARAGAHHARNHHRDRARGDHWKDDPAAAGDLRIEEREAED